MLFLLLIAGIILLCRTIMFNHGTEGGIKLKCANKQFLIKLFISVLFFFGLTYIQPVYATAEETLYLIPGGEAIGIKVETGVFIAGKYVVETKKGKISPWRESDIKNGDKILALDGRTVQTNQEIINFLQSSDEIVIMTLKRGLIVFDTNIKVVETKEGERSLGLYLKDRLIGVGTLTFIDPASGRFGSLGHGIYDESLSLGIVRGEIFDSAIASIKKALPGAPGEKRALLKKDIFGTIFLNCETGLYGTVKDRQLMEKPALPVAKQTEVHEGQAFLLTVINGGKVEKFALTIIETYRQGAPGVKGLKIKITDENLIAQTGGIVQGMSGSPIIQDKKIIGAISHVTIENPLIGYGTYIEWMKQDSACFDTS